MAVLYVLRRPRFPVIVMVETRVFRARSSSDLEKLLRGVLKSDVKIRLLDSDWAWFNVLDSEPMTVAPLIAGLHPITKQALIDLVKGRANRVEGAPSYERRSLSSRGREEIFQELVGILPAS